MDCNEILGLAYKYTKKEMKSRYGLDIEISDIIAVSPYKKFNYTVYMLINDGDYIMDITIPNHVFKLDKYIIFYKQNMLQYVEIDTNKSINILFMVKVNNNSHALFLYEDCYGRLDKRTSYNFDSIYKIDYTNLNFDLIDEI